MPQFALEAADAKIATWSTAIVDAANTIERLLSSESLPVPDGVRDLATSTTEKLRGFGTKAGEQDAKELVAGLQRTAAAHPAASIGVGAAIGAALAAVLVRMGAPAATDPDGTDQSNTGSTSTKKSAGRSSALASNVSPKPSSAKS
ncbi:MAG: hypothetical protein J0I47_08590 [Sphingomonas sp.]|nr:hypothetical protein [Sphingomonas sp.]